MLAAVIHGFVLALGLILPLGVQNVFIFNQGATGRKFTRAIPAIIAAAFGDTVLIILAVFGVSFVVLSLSWLKTVFFILGACFMIYMGWTIFRSRPAMAESDNTGLSAKKQILFALSVTFLNPHALVDTIGVIGTSSLNYEGNAKWGFTLATIMVSWIWFFGLALAGRMIGGIDQRGMIQKRINQASAFVVWFMAFYLLFTGLK